MARLELIIGLRLLLKLVVGLALRPGSAHPAYRVYAHFHSIPSFQLNTKLMAGPDATSSPVYLYTYLDEPWVVGPGLALPLHLHIG